MSKSNPDHRFIEVIIWPSGFLVSLDDFYLLGSGLMMTQTSNDIFNSSLFDTVTPNSLFAWQRVRLAHSLAHTGEEWAKTFSRYNSGGSAAEVLLSAACYYSCSGFSSSSSSSSSFLLQAHTTTSTWYWTGAKSSWVTALTTAP